ncbi:MAG TPA: dihydrofolate reductase family protein [Gammaproteobacteria bacterium]|nr:dihydrofolate reductase family protein [Gammaproteobacteria bacterium]
MTQPLTRLFPAPLTERPLEGCFLGHDLRRLGATGRPFVYSNFITSLDGRIARTDPASGRRAVPPAMANHRDWRLFMELAAQADVLVVSDRLLRAVAAGRHEALIDLEAVGLEDLVAWRRQRGLVRQPVLAAVSRDLDLPAPDLAQRYTRDILILTTDDAPAERVAALERGGVEVARAGPGPYLGGSALVSALAARGHTCIYSLAGPRMLHTLVSAGRLDRLYLTVAHLLLGGTDFDTLVRGPGLEPAAGFRPLELYWDPAATSGAGQLIEVLAPVGPA